MNKKVESLFSKRITELEITPLRNEDEQQTVITEIHDELGGVFLAQPFLGQAEDTKTTLAESFNWFEHPALVESLFNLQSSIFENIMKNYLPIARNSDSGSGGGNEVI
ncbi:MAG: hypothetical protein CMQ15_03985 [Gammaproteobacteria bacterium]|nr:hypothetical protein [Gammaproteobacteria bacterium]